MDIIRIEENSEAWAEIARGIEADRAISIAQDGPTDTLKVKIGEGMWSLPLDIIDRT